MRRRGFYFYFDFPFGIGIRRGPFFRAFWEPWRFPRREEYLRMLEEYKRDLEDCVSSRVFLGSGSSPIPASTSTPSTSCRPQYKRSLI
jgi:hypothetical protein